MTYKQFHYVPINHKRGVGMLKLVFPPAGTPAVTLDPGAAAGAIAWMKRRDGRQVELDHRYGVICCEEFNGQVVERRRA